MAESNNLCRTTNEDFCKEQIRVNIEQDFSWNDNVVRSPLPDVKISDRTIPEYIWKNAEKHLDHKALTCGVSERSYSYRELREASRNFGAALSKVGLEPGDVLSVMLPNIPEYASVVLGALEAGNVVSTINPLYTKNEISHQVKTADAKCMVTLPSLVPTVQAALETLGAEVPIITVSHDEASCDGCWDFLDMISGSDDQSVTNLKVTDPQDLALILFSSGTTGLSKGVPLTHKNIVANIEQMFAPRIDHFRETTLEHQDVLPAVIPFFHAYGMITNLFRALSKGLHLITLPKFEPQAYLDILSSQKPLSVICYCAPPLVMFFGSHPAVEPEKLKSIRVIVTGAAPVASTDIERLLSLMPNRKEVQFLNVYGLTEAAPGIFVPPMGNTKYASVGYPLPNTKIRVVDSCGRNLGPIESGEIYVKGPQVMKGYYKNDTANAEAFDGDWFKTGDVGYYDEERLFYIVDRVKDLIKVKGFQVAPAELEAILKSHPSVADAAVVGVHDNRTDEKPIAFVVPETGVNFDSDEVSNFVAEQVAPFKKLAGIILTDKIPKNATGKILRKRLKEDYATNNTVS